LGFDFGQIMARQMQRLVPLERQSLATEPSPKAEQAVQPRDDQRAHEDPHADDHTHDSARNDHAQTANKSASAAHETSETHTRPRLRPAASLKSETDNSASIGWQPPTAVTPAPLAAEATAPEATTAPTSEARTTTPLQTIELSPQVRIITDPKKAPSPESLAAFAKSMGLDESTIQSLLGEAPPTTSVTVAALPTSAGVVTTPTQPPLNAAMQLVNGNTTSTPSIDNVLATPQITTNLLTTSQIAAGPTDVLASGAGLALSASTLNAPATHALSMPGLTPTDMASIQQLQITVLPAAVLPIHVGIAGNSAAVVPSTQDMLSLLSPHVDDQAVGALLSQYADNAGGDATPDQQQSSQDGNSFGSFSQALSRNAQTAQAANAAPTNGTSMSEVYDQLSDKLATEMAARMHKQLSDGEWKMKFGLRPSNLGGVEIQLEMKDGKLDAVFRADNPLTRDLLQNSSQRLREALGNFGINAGQVQVGQGGGNAQHNGSGNSAKQRQVRDNSTSQVNGTDGTLSATSTRNKANASLLDLYA
jgi:flagellar hook-length control protein FliK